jgi:hypothetical protein
LRQSAFPAGSDVSEQRRQLAELSAAQAHVASEHAHWFFGWLPSVVSRVPSIVYQELPGAGWSQMSEVRLEEA